MTESSSLCLSCGLCCDGTLLGFVQLEDDELPALRKVKHFEEVSNHGFFLQPCSEYCDGCTIYEHRPKQCGLFKCGLLKSVEQKELDFKVALQHIEEVKLQKIAIEKKLLMLEIELQSPSFYFKMIELKKLLTKQETEKIINTKDKILLSAVHQLNRLLTKNFGSAFF
jgi:Fe-S-cluster containining protein